MSQIIIDAIYLELAGIHLTKL